MWCCGYFLVEMKHFVLWWEALKKKFSSNQEFITATCIELKSWWCFPRELSGIHKTRINLGLAVTFSLNIECACICSQLVVGFLLLSCSHMSNFGLLLGQFLPLSYVCSVGSWFSLPCSSFDSAIGTAVESSGHLPLNGELGLTPSLARGYDVLNLNFRICTIIIFF